VKEENMPIMSVATVYSGSEDEGRAEHNSDSNGKTFITFLHFLLHKKQEK
jgi:hypothetical protein